MAVDKLVDSTKLDACLDAEADAIRAKTGGSSDIPFDYANNKGFADAIASIQTGGGSSSSYELLNTFTISEPVSELEMTVPEGDYHNLLLTFDIEASASVNFSLYHTSTNSSTRNLTNTNKGTALPYPIVVAWFNATTTGVGASYNLCAARYGSGIGNCIAYGKPSALVLITQVSTVTFTGTVRMYGRYKEG